MNNTLMTATMLACLIATGYTSATLASPNDHCPGLPFVSGGFYYQCDDAQAILAGCSNNDEEPVQLNQRWYSEAGAFPNGTTWGFTMKCMRLSDTEMANVPVACYVDDLEVAADDHTTYQGNRYHCEKDEDTGKLMLTFKPVCPESDCDSGL